MQHYETSVVLLFSDEHTQNPIPAVHEPESPLYFSFDSTIQVIDNGKKYFPIQVNYSGEKPNSDYSSIEPANQPLVVNYNAEKKEYQ